VIDTPLSASAKNVKRNAKGETALHMAVIKGDRERVKKLLAEGASPNVKDFANWTPLHEACNHGYADIAEMLLDHGALINTPGNENSTPLHDAVQNYRLDCVRLLVSRGALKTLRDLYGKTAVDLAWTEELKEAVNTPLRNSVVVKEAVSPSRATNEISSVVILTTGLSRSERDEVSQCIDKLHWKQVGAFSSQVTHIVTIVNDDGSCPRTVKYLQAVLSGKWIVNIDWITTCLGFKSKVPEETFEITGSTLSPQSLGPSKGRQNVNLQLPALFSGCHFFFVGQFHSPSPPKEDLVALTRLGSGLILNREPKMESIDELQFTVPFHADPQSQLSTCGYFIVSDEASDVDIQMIGSRLCRVKSAWILACISEF